MSFSSGWGKIHASIWLVFLGIFLILLFLSCLFVCLSLPLFCLSQCLMIHKGSGDLTFTCAPSLFEHLSMGQARNPPTQGTTPLRSLCSHAHVGRVTTACVSSPRDWTVSIGSHMQLDTVISQAPPRLRVPFSRACDHSHREASIQKLAITSTVT